MKALIIVVAAATVVVAQSPAAKIMNVSRPDSADFQVGDRFEVVVTGAPNLPVSVRTMRQGRTDWGPVVAYTDASGRWSTTGQFEKQDFGEWREIWTVGGKVANPVVDLSVKGSCMPGGRGSMSGSGPNVMLVCDTTTGQQSFVTPSDGDSFRTPDGRIIAGRVRSNMTAEEYHVEIFQQLLRSTANDGYSIGEPGDHTADRINRTVGANAFDDAEVRIVIATVRAAFRYRKDVPPTTNPATLLLLQRLESGTEQENLKNQIAEAIAFVTAQ